MPNELVEQDISDKELMLEYDLEESVQKALLSYSKHTEVPLSCDLTMEAPIKVLHTVSKLIRTAWQKSLDWKEATAMDPGIVEDEMEVCPLVSSSRI